MCLYNHSSSQLFWYSIWSTPMLLAQCIPHTMHWSDMLLGASVAWVYIQPHTTLHIVRLWKHGITYMSQNHAHCFSNTRHNLNWYSCDACQQIAEVACHCILLHGSILNVSYFNWWQLPSIAVSLNHQLLLQQHAHLIPWAWEWSGIHTPKAFHHASSHSV